MSKLPQMCGSVYIFFVNSNTVILGGGGRLKLLKATQDCESEVGINLRIRGGSTLILGGEGVD